MKAVVRVTLTMIAGSAIVAAPAPARGQDVLDFLRARAGFSREELAALVRGQAVTHALDSHEKREIILFAAVRIDAPRGRFVEAYRDIERFKRGDAVLAIGRFSDPPAPADVANLRADDEEIEDLRRCRKGDCAFKLAESRITELRQFDWSAPDAAAKVEDLVRFRLVEYIQRYVKEGPAALAVYADRQHRTVVADELRAVLRASPYLYGYTPALQRSLEEFPHASLPNAASFLYWAKEKFGLKPTVNTYHVVIYHDPQRPDLSLVASKQIYASHYFEAGLELYSLVDHPAGQSTYVLYVGRSRADALRGTFGGLKKSIVQGRALDGLRRAMAAIRDRFSGPSHR